MPPNPRSAHVSKLGEFQLIQSIPRKFSTQGFCPTVGIGDDAAVLPLSPEQHLVISTDLLIEDIHFKRQTATLYDIGYKAAAANLSDIAAMGGTPTGMFVAIALPSSLTSQDWQKFYQGLAVPCKPYKVQLLGGDTCSSPTSLFITITIIGLVKPGHILTRQGAKAGDYIYVSGPLGDSAAGLAYLQKCLRPPKPFALPKTMKYLVQRHLQPSARIALGQLLASQPYASATMDLSDGLSGDLKHLCQHSHVGALIDSRQIPMSQEMQCYAKKIRKNPLPWSLHGGEDYELLFTIPPKWQQEFERKAKKQRMAISQIGVIQPKAFGIRIVQSDGRKERLPSKAYEHFIG